MALFTAAEKFDSKRGTDFVSFAEEVIRHRLVEYEQKTQPVLDYYKVSGRLVSVDGSGEITDTNTFLCRILANLMKK